MTSVFFLVLPGFTSFPLQIIAAEKIYRKITRLYKNEIDSIRGFPLAPAEINLDLNTNKTVSQTQMRGEQSVCPTFEAGLITLDALLDMGHKHPSISQTFCHQCLKRCDAKKLHLKVMKSSKTKTVS